MNKDDVTKKYNKLVSEIETLRMYDGRGEYNGYECEKCGHVTVTLYVDKGVTPFIIRCRKCGGMARHEYTSRTPPRHSDVKRWVRPTLEQLLEMNIATIKHVLNGGLVFEDELKGGNNGND